MATTSTSVNDAAKVVLEAEKNALTAINEALTAFDDALVAVQETLPSNLTLDASRIIGEMRSTYGYRRTTELPALLNRYAPPVEMPAIPTMPVSTDNG